MALLLYKNEYIEIWQEAKLFYVKSTAKGLTLEMFNTILRDSIPNIRLTNFIAVKNVLTNAPSGPEAFGEERDRITISITDDGLKAYMTLYVSEEDLSSYRRVNLVKEIFDTLSRLGVVYGIRTNLLAGVLKSGVEYLIAEGIPAVNGSNAEIKLYEITPPQPQIIDSGNVNHYELNLINRVKEGDWLGERKDPTPGTPGKTVTGKELPAVPGQNLPLLYDRVSVQESYQTGITTLYSKKNGAVYYRGDSIGVYDFLEIKGDIDYSTGNIDFNGFLSVKGTVEDNFSVIANKDVEILGEYGVGAAEKITSREGNIYIKGGIAGKNKALIRCKKNLYVKYLSDINVECEGSVYVGFYCMNANVRAKQLIVESPRGRITGGIIDTDIQVSAAEIGNRAESRTIVRVRGFDRNELKINCDKTLARLDEKKAALNRIKQQLQVYSCSNQLTEEQKSHYSNLKNQYADLKDALKELEYTYKSLNEYLKTPGEGAVIAKKRIFPRVRLEVKGLGEEILTETPMITYCARDNELKTI